MKRFYLIAIAIASTSSIGSVAQAQIVGNLLGAPLVAAGNGLNGAAAAHAGIAPTVSAAAPTVEPLTDGVTNATAAAGAGVQATGSTAQSNGVLVGQSASGQPLASVGASQPANQGTVAAVANHIP